jgi:hypothetical protein
VIIEAMSEEPIERFRSVAVRWAAGGRGQPLVDAAAQALVDGLDSPSLRMLAGAPRAAADEDAATYGPDTFEELGLDVASRNSESAIIEGARMRAADFLRGELPARELARELYGAWVATGYADDLDDWSGFDDWYEMVDTGVIAGDREKLDQAVHRAAEALVDGRRVGSVHVGDLFVAQSDKPARSVIRRITFWRR